MTNGPSITHGQKNQTDYPNSAYLKPEETKMTIKPIIPKTKSEITYYND